MALVGNFLISVKLEDHDIRAPIFGMDREVAFSQYEMLANCRYGSRVDGALARTLTLLFKVTRRN